jgi:uncharacterized lipoprotein YajG
MPSQNMKISIKKQDNHMYKLLLLIPLFLLLSGCAQQTRGIGPQTYSTSQAPQYSLEALDARYHQRY